MEFNIRPRHSHSNSFGNGAEKDTAGCRALNRKSIVIEFTKSFYYDRDVKEALDMVYEKLREQPAGCAAAFAADELEQFFKLCGDLARYNPGDEQKILNMARTMMGGLAA